MNIFKLAAFWWSVIVVLVTSVRAFCSMPESLHACSPSGKIGVKVWMEGTVKYSISYEGKTIVEPSAIDILLEHDFSLSRNNRITSSSVKHIKDQIISPVPEKRRIIQDIYTELSVTFKQPFQVNFRIYDDGVAYRILTRFKDTITIINEIAEFNFPGRPSAYFPQIRKKPDADIFHTSFEEEYPLRRLDAIPENVIGYSPVLVVNESGPKIGLTESDLYDYPGMFLGGTGSSRLKGIFAGYPREELATNEKYSQIKVVSREPYIAKTPGTRSFPWRVMIIAGDDRELPNNDMVYRLGAPSKITDTSWIKPGNVTDEWIININLFNVPFRAGLNTASYKYYIDFAKRFGFDRIMMDAGWSDNNDLFKVNPDIKMDTLIAYAREHQVKISMWTLAMTLDKQLEPALEQFNKWGIDFIMTDFIDRDDQKAVNYYHRIARACAEHKIMIMFHGAFPAKGFNRTYPNAVGREGVLGSEYNIWSNRVTPEHDVTLAFTRMLSGGFDYEPGLLNNAGKKGTRPVEGVVTSPGTRCHQLSMFVVYDSPTQIFSGNPSEGWREPEFMEFLGAIPTTWDETLILEARVGEYIVTARKKENDWYIGGMGDWSERDVTITFDFLENGMYTATICKDGINADRYAADYVFERNVQVKRNDELKIHLAPGGGFMIRLVKQ
jgi:alpha-glucosidase